MRFIDAFLFVFSMSFYQSTLSVVVYFKINNLKYKSSIKTLASNIEINETRTKEHMIRRPYSKTKALNKNMIAKNTTLDRNMLIFSYTFILICHQQRSGDHYTSNPGH